MKLYLRFLWALLLLSLPLFLAQCQSPASASSMNKDSSLHKENSPIALEDGRQIQSPIPKSSSNDTFLLDTGKATRLDFLPYEKKSLVFFSNRENYSVHISLTLALTYEVWANEPEAIKLALRGPNDQRTILA